MTILATTRAPSPDPHGISPNRDVIHVSAGPQWAGSAHLGWARDLSEYEFPTDAGPAYYEPIPYERAGRTWAQILVGKFVHPETGEPVAWAWRYYR